MERRVIDCLIILSFYSFVLALMVMGIGSEPGTIVVGVKSWITVGSSGVLSLSLKGEEPPYAPQSMPFSPAPIAGEPGAR
jgi:hypothetical protein